MEEGSTLIFGHGSLKIKGKIIAQGSEEDPVIFTSFQKEKGSWRGIQLFSKGNKLEYVKINYGGGGSAFSSGNIVLHENASLNISNSVISNSSGWGIWVSNNSELTKSNNKFKNCELGTIGYEK